MLTDEVIIKVKAGKGGDGCVSFLREKYRPKGGPDGGDGGKGGEVIFEVSADVNTLTFFNMRKVFQAENGENGKKKRCHGKNGEDLVLKVPLGTIVYEKNSNDKTQMSNQAQNSKLQKIADLTKKNQQFMIAKGGRGGWGNVHFATATHQAPKEANPGAPGEEKTLKLEIQMIADVGIIGLPNSGKSTLLSRVSAAKPKIADYPFTTLEPNLGVVLVDKNFSFVAADIPGLIEGASQGRGLGDKFLKHIQRTKILVHLIDINSLDICKDYNIIRNELSLFNKDLAKKQEIIVLNKVETVDKERVKYQISSIKKKTKKIPLLISAVTGQGVKELLYKIKKELK